jgi:GT2 family glycosyltransferase
MDVRESSMDGLTDTFAPGAQVSVVMPAFNAERWISEALASVFRQTFTDYEVVVVDDGSTDQTAREVCQSVG